MPEENAVVAVASFPAAGLTFFTGFGLGTILLSFFLFFTADPRRAVPMVAVVHPVNSIFKLAITFKQANPSTVLLCGIPAMIFAYAQRRR